MKRAYMKDEEKSEIAKILEEAPKLGERKLNRQQRRAWKTRATMEGRKSGKYYTKKRKK